MGAATIKTLRGGRVIEDMKDEESLKCLQLGNKLQFITAIVKKEIQECCR